MKVIGEEDSPLLEGDDSKADELFQKAEEQEERSIKRAAEAAFQRAKIAEDRIDYRKALGHYQRAVQLQPDVSVYLNELGLMYDTLGDYRNAIEVYDKALEIDIKSLGVEHPQVAVDWNNLGGAWHALGEYEKAIEYYEMEETIGARKYE